MENGYFPMFFDIAGKQILLVGGGSINLRRVNTLLGFGADLTVVAPEAKSEIIAFAEEGKLRYIKAAFYEELLNDTWFMVIASTNDHELNYRVTALGREKGFLVNNAADKSDCDFYFPAIVREKDVVAGVCAGGKDHRLVRRTAAAMRGFLSAFLSEE